MMRTECQHFVACFGDQHRVLPLRGQAVVLCYNRPAVTKRFHTVAAGIRVPVHLGHGRKDPVVPFAAFEKLRRLLPEASTTAWDEGGHMQMVTHPELFSDLAPRAVPT